MYNLIGLINFLPFQEKLLIKKALEDLETMANVSVQMYYTRAFAASTRDVVGAINNVLAKTNQGFINSGVKINLYARCVTLFEGEQEQGCQRK